MLHRGGKKNCLSLYVPIPKGIDEPAKEVITSFGISQLSSYV